MNWLYNRSDGPTQSNQSPKIYPPIQYFSNNAGYIPLKTLVLSLNRFPVKYFKALAIGFLLFFLAITTAHFVQKKNMVDSKTYGDSRSDSNKCSYKYLNSSRHWTISTSGMGFSQSLHRHFLHICILLSSIVFHKSSGQWASCPQFWHVSIN